jgi:uncharacterized protein involved in type VI secretion and phage assembly
MSDAVSSSVIERPLVKINGADISPTMDANLLDTRVDLVMNGVGQATLRFFDADFKLLDDAAIKIGASVSVSFSQMGLSMVEVFKGEIVGLATEQGPTDLHELVITAYDRGHRLSRSTEVRTYQNVSYSDVVTTIAGRYGLSASVSGLTAPVFPYLLQTTDDGSFLTEIAARSGAQWRIVGDKLEMKGPGGRNAAPVAELTWGKDLRRFRTRFNGTEVTSDVQMRSWDPVSKTAIVGTAATPGDLMSSAGEVSSGRSAAATLGTTKRIGTHQVFTSADEATAVANSLRTRIDATNVRARGECFGTPALLPGARVKVAGVGSRFSGEYYLTSVEHVYTPTGYVCRFDAGNLAPSTVVDLLGQPAPTNLGAVIGVVTNNKDTSNQGRVKVKFPAMADNAESDWARVVSVGGGPSRGFLVTPAVNDEVLVMFEGGDFRRPLVIGGLWNGKDAPPLTADASTKEGKTTKWQVKTTAGHTLTFDETGNDDTKHNVTILLADGTTKLYLGKDKVELWSNQKNLEVKSGQASVLLANGKDVTIQGVNVTIKAQTALKLEGMTVEATGQTSAKIGAAQVEVKGSGMTSLEAGGPMTVKGMPVKIN